MIMASDLTEQQLRCSICRNVFNNPASIPCGHNYCMDCIKNYWDTTTTCECPNCKMAFKLQPDLSVNWVLKHIAENFKSSLRNKTTPPNLKHRSMSANNTSDYYQDTTSAAVKMFGRHLSCRSLQTTGLGDEVQTRRTASMRCIRSEHNKPETIHMTSESTEIRKELKKKEKDIEDMIQARMRKAEEIKVMVNQCKKDQDIEIQKSTDCFTVVRVAVEAQQSLLQEEIMQEQEQVDRRSYNLLKEIQGEIEELQRRHSELRVLKDSTDPPYLIQRYQSLTAPLSTKDWSRVKLQSDNHIGTARNIFTTLADVCHQLENQLCAVEVSRIEKYAVDLSLDPATAATWLLLSPDGKKVSLGGQPQGVRIPSDPRRFDSCTAILAKQSFTSGRHYWIVQVGDKPDWDLGVARESISRSGLITVRPDTGYWAICRRKAGSLIACAGPSFHLQLQQNPRKVGVFLDYEKGSVTFYDSEAKSHIHTYSGCSFTEPLYPYFNPCNHDSGRNIAPLIICPVEP